MRCSELLKDDRAMRHPPNKPVLPDGYVLAVRHPFFVGQSVESFHMLNENSFTARENDCNSGIGLHLKVVNFFL